MDQAARLVHFHDPVRPISLLFLQAFPIPQAAAALSRAFLMKVSCWQRYFLLGRPVPDRQAGYAEALGDF